MADKILICIPCRDWIEVKFIENLMNLQKPCEAYYRFATTGLVYDARDEACQIAMNDGYSHILFIDSDMYFEPMALIKALKRDTDIVTGLYFKRKENHEPVLYKKIDQRRYNEDGTVKAHGLCEIVTDFTEDYFQVEGCGFGFVLVKTELIKKMHKNHFSWFEPIEGMGEDLSFCQRLKDYDVKLMCDTTIRLGHYGQYMYTAKDWVEDESGIKIEWNSAT